MSSRSPYFFFLTTRPPPGSTLFPYTTLFRSRRLAAGRAAGRAGERRRHGEAPAGAHGVRAGARLEDRIDRRSEEHTSELQSRPHLVCRLLLEKKKSPTTTQLCLASRQGDGLM